MDQETSFEKKNVVVTGGAGFIGSHLCDELVKTSHVVCIDNFLTGSEENIHHLLSNPNFKFLRHDVTTPIRLESFPELKLFHLPVQGVQEIYHLACPASPKEYHQLQVETLLANALGTKHALDLAVQYKAKLLHFSSSAVYGAPLDAKPFLETYWGFVDPIGPRSSYVEGKRFAESMVLNYQLRYQIEVKILRVFNTYGPRMKLTDGRMIPDFIHSALQNEPITIYGDERAISSCNFITDLLEAVTKVMASNETGPMNIGNPEVRTMKDIAGEIVRMTNSTSTISYHEPAADAMTQGIPDIALAKERLGWFPVISLETGLQQTIDFMRASRHLGLGDVSNIMG